MKIFLLIYQNHLNSNINNYLYNNNINSNTPNPDFDTPNPDFNHPHVKNDNQEMVKNKKKNKTNKI